MKIIKRGVVPTHTAECDECHALVEFARKEVAIHTLYAEGVVVGTLRCPECACDIHVSLNPTNQR